MLGEQFGKEVDNHIDSDIEEDLTAIAAAVVVVAERGNLNIEVGNFVVVVVVEEQGQGEPVVKMVVC